MTSILLERYARIWKMSAYDSKFHDGFVDGFLIRESQVIIFIRTDDNEAFAMVADDVTRMRVDNLLQGNIIFDIVMRQGRELTRSDMDVYGFAASPDDEKLANDKLERLRTEDRVALEINPSYGCKCFLIAQSVALIPRSELKCLNLW
jgi:hypothetical protein